MNREPLKKLSWIGIPWDGNVTQGAFHQLSKILPGIYSLLEVIVHLVWRDCAPFLTFISYHLSFSILSSGHSSPQSGLFSFCSWIAEGKYKISAVTTSDFLWGDMKTSVAAQHLPLPPCRQPTDWVLSVRCADTKFSVFIGYIFLS